MKIGTKEGIDGLGTTICFLALIISALIYPLLILRITWIIIIFFCLGMICFSFLVRGTFNIPKAWFYWILTLFPLLYNSQALKNHEIGFTLMWITLLIMLPEATLYSRWIKHAINTIGILTGIYAFSTILFNLSKSSLFREIATFYRGEIETGTLATAGLTAHYSHNGMYIAIGCVLWYAKALESKKIKDFIFLGIFLVALLFTQKRGPLIALVAAMAITYYVVQRGSLNTKIKRLLITLLVILIAAYLLSIFLPSSFAVFERFSEGEDTLTNREYLWQYAIDCFKKKSMIGNGWGSYSHNLSLSIDTVRVKNMNAHNIYLQLLAETGIVGFVCFMIPILFTFIKGVVIVRHMKEKSTPMYYAVGMQTFFLVYGLSGNPLYDKQMVIPYMIAVAIVLHYNQKMLKSQRGIEK